MAEKMTLAPVIFLSAANLAYDTYSGSGYETDAAYVALNAAAYPNGIETSKWGGFVCAINVLSYDGTPTLLFKVQHSAVDPSTVSYDPWVDLVKFPPIQTVGVFHVEVPNESVKQFGRWLRVVHMQINGTSGNAASIGNIIFGARE